MLKTIRKTMRPCLGLEVAEAATRLATEIYRITRQSDRRTRACADGLRRSADGLALMMARVQGLVDHAEFIHAIATAGVMLAETEGYLMMAEQCGIIGVDDLDLLQPLVGFIKRFCIGSLGIGIAPAVRSELVS